MQTAAGFAVVLASEPACVGKFYPGGASYEAGCPELAEQSAGAS